VKSAKRFGKKDTRLRRYAAKIQFSLLNYKHKEISNKLFEISLSLFVFSFPVGSALYAAPFCLARGLPLFPEEFKASPRRKVR